LEKRFTHHGVIQLLAELISGTTTARCLLNKSFAPLRQGFFMTFINV